MARVIGGGVTIEGVWAATPASRLNGFAPTARVVAQKRELLGSGEARAWIYRAVDYGASFDLTDIPNTALEDCLTLAAYLDGGGVFTIETDDRASRVYPNCQLPAKADAPQPELSDPVALRYTMAFRDVRNLDGTPLIAVY